jgi:hypothetical protein
MRVLALIERLSAMLESRAEVVRRADLNWGMLRPYGLAEDDSLWRDVCEAGDPAPRSKFSEEPMKRPCPHDGE